jgi:hypothetical protein
MEIVQERLEREFDQDLITTAPTVVYEVLMRDGTTIQVENPAKLPEVQKMEEIREPIINQDIRAAGIPRFGDYAVREQARPAGEHGLPRSPGAADLRYADGRSGDGLFRQA